jgi:hypothetical protein
MTQIEVMSKNYFQFNIKEKECVKTTSPIELGDKEIVGS